METKTKQFRVVLKDENESEIRTLEYNDLGNAQGYAFTMLGFETYDGLVCSVDILTLQADGTFALSEQLEY